MYGLEAISANNGWAMAITGPLIVMSGLTILAIIISQLHKVVAIFDKKDDQSEKAAAIIDKKDDQSKDQIPVPNVLPGDILETAEIYQALIDKLEQPFELSDLYQLAKQNNFPHPIITASRFRDAGILTSDGEGLFIWNNSLSGSEEFGGAPVITSAAPAPVELAPAAVAPAASVPATPTAPAAPVAAPTAPVAAPTLEPKPEHAPAPAASAGAGTAVTAPMPGMVIKYEKNVGAVVSEGETVVVIEAMKMENALPSPISGKVAAVKFNSGDAVAKDDVLAVIE